MTLLSGRFGLVIEGMLVSSRFGAKPGPKAVFVFLLEGVLAPTLRLPCAHHNGNLILDTLRRTLRHPCANLPLCTISECTQKNPAERLSGDGTRFMLKWVS